MEKKKYTADFKEEVLDYYKTHTQRETADKFNVSQTMVCYWAKRAKVVKAIVKAEKKEPVYTQLQFPSPTPTPRQEEKREEVEKKKSKIAIIISDDANAILDVLRGL